jgi:hypothetical protein
VMLSNLRFNVIAQFAADGSALVLTLKPRSMNGYVPAASLKEMSFLLSGVVVHQYTAMVSVDIDIWEKYKDRDKWSNNLYVRLTTGS